MEQRAVSRQVEELIAAITREFEGLSRQLKIIARYVEKHREHIGLEGIQDVARHCGVQPSAVVRFAKHFGYSGYSELQAVFRERLSQRLVPERDYRKRIREVIAASPDAMAGTEIARTFLEGSIEAMQSLVQDLDESTFEAAVDRLVDADAIWICGFRRSFPIAAYLDYALQHTDKRVGLFSSLGNMHEGQLRSVRPGDVLIAISFAPYAGETLLVAEEARRREAHVIVITDSRLCRLARLADTVLVVQDGTTFGFRSLTSTMGLAQSLFIALAYRLELLYEPTTRDRRTATG